MADFEHHLYRCKKCTGIVTQCRCPSPHKTERWVETCLDCIRIEEHKALSLNHDQVERTRKMAEVRRENQK